MNKKMKNLAIIGCGNMGGGIARRLAPLYNLYLFDRNKKKMEMLEKDKCGTPCSSMREAFEKSDILLLAIKPQGVKDFAREIEGQNFHHTVISLLSGTTIEQLKGLFPGQKIVRMMPNLAVTSGESALGMSTEENFSKSELQELNNLCNPLGKIYWIPETKINAFTALAGSGIAYVFAIIEAMVEAGISMGFNAEESQELAHQTIKGGISLLESTQKHPAELKWKVTSPGGTTIAGLLKFEDYRVRSGIIQTYMGAYNRAIELSNS